MLLHDAVGDGEAEPRALSDRLRREERVEDSGQHVVGMPGPVSRMVVTTRCRRLVVEITIEPGRPVPDDGVLGVDDHVQECLLQEQRIADDGGDVVSLVAHEVDARACQRAAPAGDHPREHALDAQPAADRVRCEPEKVSRFWTILAARSASR